jgi:outer membrane protein TolC
VGRDIQTFRDIVEFNHLSVLVDGFILRAIPELEKHIHDIAQKLEIDIKAVGMETSAEEALKNLPPSTEAVLTTSLMRISPDEFQKLITGLIQRGLPGYSYWGRDDVELGILASTTPRSTLQHLARAVAVNVLDILQGEDAGSLISAFTVGEQLTINMATARAIDVYPSLSILTEADLLNEERKDIQRVLTLEQAVQEAISANLDLSAADRNVAAGEEQVNTARSQLFPQVDIGTGFSVIDDDRARVSRGVNPERTWTGSATATQLIYSDKVWSNYTVERYRQTSRVEGREALRLDIVQATATAYLNLLRAKAIERIQKNNLKLTRANLERARVRVSIGIAGPEEVYRWESEIANSRQSVLNAESVTLDTMNTLNRLLNRPQQEQFVAKETELSDPLLVMSDRLFFNLVKKPKNFRVFREFMVQQGLEIAPELQQFDADIAARERELTSAGRDYWLPTFSAQGNVTELFADGGDGERNQDLTGLNDTEWSAGVFATFPLFEGGAKGANYRRTKEERARLKIERKSTAQRIEQRVHNAINLTRSSYPGIRLSRNAADAAQGNLKLVTDSYARGIKTIIDLLDAQNLILVADQRAANAVYDFLVDLMSLQRAVGQFDLFWGPEERQVWNQKLEDFFKNASVDPDRG